MAYNCANTRIYSISDGLIYDTIFAIIINGLVGISQTQIKLNLVIFDNELSVLTASSETVINLHISDGIVHMDYISLIHRDSRSLLPTGHHHEFGIAFHDISNYYSGNKYIHDGYRVILINFGKSLMGLPFQ